jgi:hypothetical protein
MSMESKILESFDPSRLSEIVLGNLPDSAAPDGWGSVQGDIDAISRLEPDWDGMGGSAPSSALIDGLGQFLLKLRSGGSPPPARIVPTPLGTILLEWYSAGTYTEAEIVAPNRVEIMELQPDRPAVHRVVNLRIGDV